MTVNEIVEEYSKKDILVEGPIPVTEATYPFDSMKHCRVPYDLREHGFCEEEYFVSGFANVYDESDEGKLIVKKIGMPYKTRVLIRKPIEESKFSGRVYLDILNATNGYDHEDLWTRIYDWCVENGHGYIGITSKPITALALKNFDYERYKTLNWSNGEVEAQPICCAYDSIPGTEEGLFWDMLTQTAQRIKSKNENNFFNGWNVQWLYLTGQSQSGAYLNTYTCHFDKYNKTKDGHHIFDGYMNIVGAFLKRKLCQEKELKPLSFECQEQYQTEVPFIKISSEGDLYLFKRFGICGNIDKFLPVNENKCRYYEISGSPHFDIKCPVIVCDEDIKRAKKNPHIIPDEKEQLINDFPLAYYIVALLDKLHLWVTEGIAPEIAETIERSSTGEIKRDENGNVEGGLRTVFMKLPLATYEGCDMGAHMGVVGIMRLFSEKRMKELYGTKERYRQLFIEQVTDEVENGWLTQKDAKKVEKWLDCMLGKIK